MIRRSLQIAFLALAWAGAALPPSSFAGGASSPPAAKNSPAKTPAASPSPTAPAPPAAAPDGTTKSDDTSLPPAKEAAPDAASGQSEGQAAPAQAKPEPAPTDANQPPEHEQKATAPSLDELLQPVASLSSAIDAAEKRLEQAPSEQRELATFRGQLETIRFDAKSQSEKLRPRLEEVRSQIAKLGEPPAEGQPPEAREVVEERARLNKIASQIDGAIKTADLVEVRARQLIGRVQELRQGIFTRFLLLQSDSPLRIEVWKAFADKLPDAQHRTSFIINNWWSLAVLNWMALAGVLAAAFLVFVVLRAVRDRMLRAYLDAPRAARPTLPERAATAVWVMIAFAVPSVVAALVLYGGLDQSNLLYWQVERFAQSALFSFLVFEFVSSLARAALQPQRPAWRVVDLSDAAAAVVSRAVQGIVAVYALDFLGRRVISLLSLPAAASVVLAFLAAVLYVTFIAAIVRTPFAPWTLPPGAPVSRWRPYWLKLLLAALGIALIATTLLGYVSLSRFIAGQTLMTGSGLLLVALLHIAIRGIHAAPTDEPNFLSRVSERVLRFGETGRERFARFLRLALNVILIAIAAPLVLLAWGVTTADILGWLRTAIFGFEVNGVRISLARIFFAVVLFFVLVSLTRLFQRWLQSRATSQSRWDPGLVNSVYTGTGYIGFALAFLVAIAYAGFDITSLAIVAGALSVGIGFGLQNIVNNFVSGLVLLVERPIKVGDWIAIKDGEGYVRRISVRSTEIETFDRASLIIPNAEMVSQTVTNLTHRNQLGRLNISVRVSYAADPELAYQVLEQVAAENTSILRHPAPIIVLDNLGDQAMEYSLRVYLADINQSLRVQTEVRMAIIKGLRAAGVDIPYFAVQIGHATGPQLAPGRVTVKISTVISSDPDAVLAALKEASNRTNGVRSEPEPEIAFDNVTDSALEFSVDVTVAEDANARAVETALRASVVKTLRAHGIEIAGPLHDVRLRDLDGLRGFLLRLAEERMPQPSDADVPPEASMPKGKPS